ncbi:MAG: BatD family protein [Candidatus Omnitrophota bacterium]
MRKLLILLLFLSFSVPGVLLYAQQDTQVTATLDKRSAAVNEEVALSIKITGAQGNIQAPRLPTLQGFDTFYTGRSSHFTFVNGRSTSTVDFSYVLVGRKEGNFTVPAIEVIVNNQSYKTVPMEMTVRGAVSRPGYAPQAPAAPSRTAGNAPAVPSPQLPTMPQGQSADDEPVAPAGFVPDDQNIFASATVDKTTVYPNQQILLSYSLYTRYDTRYEGFEEEPQVSGFWIEEFPQEREVKRENVRMNGLKYIKADIRKMALFPTAPAEYTIQPGTLKTTIRQEPVNSNVFDEFFNDSFFSGGSFFSRREGRLLKPPAIHVTVLPFPEAGKPDGFQGAVGNFKMAAGIDKQAPKQNEPVTLKIVIEGEGNIETLNRPKVPDLKGVRTYDGDTNSQLFQTGDVIGGRKTFETVFIPTEPGKLVIPKLEFSFFNPNTRTYQTLTTPEYVLIVEKSGEAFKMPVSLSRKDEFKKEVELESQDIRFIEERTPEEKKARWVAHAVRILGAADVLLFAALLAGFWQSYQEKVFAKNSGLKRRRFARQTAMERIRKMGKLSHSRKSEDTTEYFEEIDKTLTHYLADKFGLSAYGTTRQDLEATLLTALGAEDPLYLDIMSIYQICDESRFAKASVAQEHKAKAMKILKTAISRVERIRIR